MIEPHTLDPPGNVGNVLQRWPLLNSDGYFRELRSTPLGNPRAISASQVHWLGVKPTRWDPAKFYNQQQSVDLLRLWTVHVMGLTRPQLNKKKGEADPWYQELAQRLEIALQAHKTTISDVPSKRRRRK